MSKLFRIRVFGAGAYLSCVIAITLIMFLLSFPTASIAETYVSGNITQNTTWTQAASPYIVTGDVTVRHLIISAHSNPSLVKLTIEPGVEVRFNPGTGLYIGSVYNSIYGYYGALSAHGTDDASITFTSNASTPSPGDWKGIYFRNETHDSETILQHCVIEYGGHTHGANLVYVSANPPSQSSTIRHSSGHGIYLDGGSNPVIGVEDGGNIVTQNANFGIYCNDTEPRPSVRYNTISRNGSYPMRVKAAMAGVHHNLLLENGINAIQILGEEITANTTWHNNGVPFVVSGDVTVRHPSTTHYSNPSSVKLTIEPGVEVRFNPGTGLHIGRYSTSSYGYYGALLAQGTAESPITLTSNAASPAPGDWKGIYFRNETHDAETILDHCVIEYGGHTHSANLVYVSANPPIQSSTIRYSSGHGIYLDGGSNPVIGVEDGGNLITENGSHGIYCNDTEPRPTVRYNTISRNGSYPIRVRARMAGVHHNLLSENGIDAIQILGEEITTNTTWYNNGVPFVIAGDVTVRHPSTSHYSRPSSVKLTIDPGVEVRFNPGTGLYIGRYSTSSYGYYGALLAQGTAESPITFTSNAAFPAPGDWKGIYFRNETHDSETLLEYCLVEHGGQSHSAGMTCASSSPAIKFTQIRHTSGNGLHLNGGSPAVTNCEISENSGNGIYLEATANPRIGSQGQGNTIAFNGSSGIYCEDASPDPIIEDNTISNNGSLPLRVGACMRVYRNSISDNASQSIAVVGEEITRNTTWYNNGVPFVIAGDVTVRHSSTTHYSNPSSVKLTIEPGVEVRFNPGTGLYIGRYSTSSYGYYGALLAQGTAESPITFTSNAATPAAGDWKGIHFRNESHDSQSLLEHCAIEYGGHTHNADIYLANAKPTLQYNTIRNSSHSGVYVNGTGANGAAIRCNNFKDNLYGVATINNAQPGVTGNNFLTNLQYGIYNSGTATVNGSGNWWNDPNGPGYNGDEVSGPVNVSPWLTAESECISTPPTNTAPFTPKAPTPANGAVRVPVLSEGQPIAVTLSWTGGDPNPWDTVVYDVYFGTDAAALVLVAENLEARSLDKDGLAGGVTYYWQVVARDDAGAETAGPLWHFTILGDPPDLGIVSIGWQPTEGLTAGQTVTFTVVLKNVGSGPVVDAFKVDFRIDGNSIGTVLLNAVIAAGDSVQAGRSWTAATGQHVLEVVADSTGSVTESYEENNTLAAGLPYVTDPTAPELKSTAPANGAQLKQVNQIVVTLFDRYGSVDDAATAGSLVVLHNGSQPVNGTVSEDSDRFTFIPDTAPLPDGSYQVSLTAQDREGNSADYGFAFSLDSRPPQGLTITGGEVLSGPLQVRPAVNRCRTASVAVTGTREDGAAVYVNGQKKVEAGSGDWSVSLSLAQGDNSLEIWLQDAAGNRSDTVWVDLRVDSTPPVVTGITPAAGSFVNAAPETVVVTFSEATSALNPAASSLTVADQQSSVAGIWALSGTDQLMFTPAAALIDSQYTVGIQLEDEFTNRSALKTYQFTVDTVAPPAPGLTQFTSPTHTPRQTIAGTKEAFAAILVNGRQVVDHTAETSWQHSVDLFGGSNSFAILARDRAGNDSAPTPLEIVFDDVAPPAVETLTVNPDGDGTTLTLNWSGYDEALHGDVHYYRIYVEPAAFSELSGLSPKATVPAGGFTYRAGGLARGSTCYLAVVAVDLMGNANGNAAPVAAIPRDVVAPEDVTNLKAQSFADRLVFTWSAPADTAGDLAGYRVYFGNHTEGQALPADQTSYERGGLAAASGYVLRVAALDDDANQSSGATVTGVTLLVNPANLTAEPYSGYLQLAWAPALPAQYVKRYALYLSETDFSSVAGMTPTLFSSTTTAKVAGLTNGVAYYLAVTAVNLSDGETQEVATISATPAADSEGPVIAGVQIDEQLLSDGYTLSRPATFSCQATDPAGVSRVEFFIDGSLVRTDYNAVYSCYWNIVAAADGEHTLSIEATDSLGNRSSVQFAVNVALEAPAAPAITQPGNGVLANKPTVTVSGYAEKYSEVILYLDDAEVGAALALDALGNFSGALTLAEGENRIQAAARNRAGIGPRSGPVLVTLDTSLPTAPGNLTASAGSGGIVQLTWQKPTDMAASGYNLYRSSISFGGPEAATRLNSKLITTLSYIDLPPQDGTWYYRAGSVDGAGNESELSAEASARADSTAPRAVLIACNPQGRFDPATGTMAPGTVNLVLTVSEALQALPYLSIVPQGGTPISVELHKESDTSYRGFFVIAETTAGGTAYAIFSGRDIVGNRGTEIDAGAAIGIDTDGPAVKRLIVEPRSPIDNQPAGTAAVVVTIGLSEPIKAADVPSLSYRLDGEVAGAVALGQIETQPGESQTWQGSFILAADAGSSGAQTLSFAYQGADALDNVSQLILAENQFQVYQGELPPLEAPSELTAQTLSGGRIRLAWHAVAQAVGYELYRQGPGESQLTVLERAGAVTEFSDTPGQDGLYTYAVASIRCENEQEAVSGLSAPVTAASDSVAPGAPQGFALELVSNGIKAAWQPPAYTEPITYSLYRAAAAEITSVEGLTPLVTGITQTMVVDPTPSPSEHCYVVTAVDAAGNDSMPSDSGYLNVALLPVSSLKVVQAGLQLPVVSWTHPRSGSIAGYDIYLGSVEGGVKLNSSPLPALSYTDIGYAGDERTYTIVAKDGVTDSLGRSISLPPLSAVLVEGSRLQRGIMNRLQYVVENHGASWVGNIRLKAAVAGRNHLSELLHLNPGTSETVAVVVGGYDDLAALEALTATIELTPATNESVQIVCSSTIEVDDGTLVLQILNDEFTRAASGQVRFSLQNSGEAEVEVVTAANQGKADSNDIKVYLVDADDNVLATRAFRQSVGEGIVTLSNANSVARIGAGQTFTSQALSIPVPANAPDDVVLRLEIANIYYHQGKPEQVKMKGLAGTHPVTLVDTSYYGQVTAIAPENSTGSEPVVITGRAVERATAEPLADVPLKLVVTLNGFERKYEVYTGADGTFTHSFEPLAGEAGVYTVRAVHPDLTDKPIQGRFTITRASVTPTSINLNLSKNYAKTISVKLTTGNGTSINNLHLVYVEADQPGQTLAQGVHLTPGAGVAQLAGKKSTLLPFTIWADNSAAGSAKLKLQVVSDEQTWAAITVNAAFCEAKPVLVFSPDHVESGVALGGTVSEAVSLQNKGLADLYDLRLSLLDASGSPAPDWVYLNAAADQGTLEVGESRPIGISFSPAGSAAAGDYAFKLRLTSSNHATTDVNLYVVVTQQGLGNLQVKVTDIYTGTFNAANERIQGLAGAKVTLQNEQVLSESYSRTSDRIGEAYFQDLPAGQYKCRVSAQNHQEFVGRVWIKPGITANQDVFLDYNLVTVEWTVTEITIEDKYEIVLTATYETDVPAAVVVVEPTSVTLPKMSAGDVFNGEFTLTNYGIIRADEVKLSLPANDPYFKYEVIGGLPESLEAKQRISVPYRLTCIKSLDQAEEGSASGGGCSSYRSCARVDYGYRCSNGVWSKACGNVCWTRTYGTCGGTAPIITGSGGGTWNVSGGSGGGTVSKPAPAAKPIAGVKCFPQPQRKEGFCLPCYLKGQISDFFQKVLSSVNLVMREYFREEPDLSVKVPGGMIEAKRWYFGNGWRWEHTRHNLKFKQSSLGNSIESIDKDGVLYKAGVTSADVFTHEFYRIVRTEGGWRWEHKNGEWKLFDQSGRMTEYGSRTGTIGKLLYEDGRLAGVADRSDTQVLWYEYDGDLISAVRDSTNRRVEYGYTDGRLSSVADVAGGITRFEYDDKDRIEKVIDAENHESHTTYDSYGHVASVVDGEAKGHFFEWDYDEATQVTYVRISSSAGKIRELWFNRDGEPTRVDVNGRTVQKIARDGRDLIVTDELGRVTRKDYDEWDNLTGIIYPDATSVSYEYEHTFNRRTKETDENSVVTEYEYDASGNLIRKTEAAGTADERVTEYSYDDDGNLLTTRRLADGNTAEALTQMAYDDLGNLISITDPEGGLVQFTSHDVMGNPLTRIDARGKPWSYEYDAAGRLTAVTDPMVNDTEPLRNVTRIFYDHLGNKIREVDPQGKQTRYDYDNHSNLIKVSDHLGNITQFEYNADSQLIRQIDAEGKEIRYEYDADGRLVKTIDGNGNEIEMEYGDAAGAGCESCGGKATDQPSRIVYPTFEKLFSYDQRGRKILETDVLSDTESYVSIFGYDDAGNLISRIDKEQKATAYEYDPLNRMTTVTDALLNDTLYTYDNRDNLMAVTDAKNNTTRFEYDRNNRLKKEIRPEGQETSYDYDDAGNLIEKIDAKNQKTEYRYDDAGRLAEIRYYTADNHATPIKTVTFTYDCAGNLTGYDDGTTSATYAYDNLYRKLSETVDYGPFQLSHGYTYYKNGLKKTFTGPDVVTYEYSYDANNQLTAVKIPNVGSITYASYTWNRPDELILPGGTRRQYEYDPLMRVKAIIARDPAHNILMNYQYDYDKMDNIKAKDTEHGQYDYGYDDLYRLTGADNPIRADEGFSYDAVGNRLTAAGVADNWSYNHNNELQAYNGVSFQYDANGNAIQKNDNGVATHYIYNVADRLTRVEDGSGSLISSYYYDPFGRRLWKEVGGIKTYPVYADEGLVTEVDEAGNVIKSYGYKPGSTWTTDPLFLKQGSEYYLYQNDHLGTPQNLTAVNGAVVWSAKYSSFGEAEISASSTVTNNLRFPGQYFDQETGLHYNWHRYYGSVTGKYLRPDPIGFLGGDLNLSAYSFNNPINGIDPLGLQQYNAATAYHLLHHGYRPPQIPKRIDKPKEDLGTYDPNYEFWTTEKLSSCEVNGFNKCRVLYNTEIEIHNKYWLEIIQMDLGGDTRRPSQARLSTIVSKAIELRMIRDVYENCIKKRIEECSKCIENIRFDYESTILP